MTYSYAFKGLSIHIAIDFVARVRLEEGGLFVRQKYLCRNFG